VVDVYKKEPQGKIPHFYTARFVVSVGEHTLEVCPEFFYSCIFLVFLAKVTVINNMPPVTLSGSCT